LDRFPRPPSRQSKAAQQVLLRDKPATKFRKEHLYSPLDFTSSYFLSFRQKTNKILFQICGALPTDRRDVEHLTPVYQILAIPASCGIIRESMSLTISSNVSALFAPSTSFENIWKFPLPQPLVLGGEIWKVSRGLNTSFQKMLGPQIRFGGRIGDHNFSHPSFPKSLRQNFPILANIVQLITRYKLWKFNDNLQQNFVLQSRAFYPKFSIWIVAPGRSSRTR